MDKIYQFSIYEFALLPWFAFHELLQNQGYIMFLPAQDYQISLSIYINCKTSCVLFLIIKDQYDVIINDGINDFEKYLHTHTKFIFGISFTFQ